MQHTSLLIIVTTVVLYNQCVAQQKMYPYITCFENNRERPTGFRETLTYLNDSWCAEEGVEDLCSKYRNETFPYAGTGDVCDKPDPTTLITRNACKMEITFGSNETAEHTWSWKCTEVSTCILKDRNGIGRTGCKYTNKRINCCCNEYDYCNGDEHTPIGQLYTKLATFGRSDQFPINFTELLSINPGDIYVEIDTSVPGWETFQYGNISQEITTSTTMPPIGNITACNHGDNLVDIILLVDASCPMEFEQCEQQQQFIANTMASLRGIDTININNSIMSQVRIGYIKFLGRGESIVLIDLASNDSLNIDITDPELARTTIYNIVKDSDICNNINQRSGAPNLLNGLNTAYDLFDEIDDGSIVNSTSDKILLIFSNCGVTNPRHICDLYTERFREDLKIIMVNNPDVNDSMSEPETYIECLVDDLNRIFVTDDRDNYTYIETISQLQVDICENITTSNHPSMNPNVISTTTTTHTTKNTVDWTVYILWGALALLGICCVVVILGICYKQLRNDTYVVASDNEHDQTVAEEFTDAEQQRLVVNI